MKKIKPNKNNCFVDLFAGCGGLSLGLEYAGFFPVFVNEINNNALNSYLINRKDHFPLLEKKEFHCNDVKELVNKKRIQSLKLNFKKSYSIDCDKGDLALLVGGPPCQGFSGIGHRRSYSVDKEQLPSNHLYQDMAWIINQLMPKVFLFENVKGLITAKWNDKGSKGEIWEDVKHTFRSIPGYRIEPYLVLAKNYGVPQNRPRVLIVGVRDDIDLKPWNKNKSSFANGFLPEGFDNSPDLIDLLGDLIDNSFDNGGSTMSYPTKVLNEFQKWFRTRLDGTIAPKGTKISEHEYSKHSKQVRDKFNYMLSNQGKIHLNHKTKKFSQRLLRLRWGPKGPNITATSLPDDYVHFSQPRILTVREWARLQGFPDWYQFCGSRTTGGLRRAGNPREGLFDRELPRYTQIGNAVPVWLARALGEHFKKILK